MVSRVSFGQHAGKGSGSALLRFSEGLLQGGHADAVAEIAKALAVSQNDVERGLVMLDRYQILKRDESAGGVGYAVAAPRYLNWHPRLDFIFHRMAISSGGSTVLTSVN